MTKRKVSGSAHEIIDYLRTHPNSSARQIADGINKSIKYVLNNIVRLLEQNKVKRFSARLPTYRLSDVTPNAQDMLEKLEQFGVDMALVVRSIDKMVRVGARA